MVLTILPQRMSTAVVQMIRESRQGIAQGFSQVEGPPPMYQKLVLALSETCDTAGKVNAPLPDLTRVIGLVDDLRALLLPALLPPLPCTTESSADSLRTFHARLSAEIQCAVQRQRESLGIQLSSAPAPGVAARQAASEFLHRLPAIAAALHTDLEAAFSNDPAAKTRDEILLCYPGFAAITVYRIANALFTLQVPYLPRMMTEWAHYRTGIDIHPGATIGSSFFIDHGTGVVIGETCRIGSGVTLYQGVTLGAWSFPRDDDGRLIRGTRRHPTLEDHVTVYSNATILGGDTIIGAGSKIGSSVSLNCSVPPNTIVTIERPSLRFRDAA